MDSQLLMFAVFDAGGRKRLHVRAKEARKHNATFQPTNPKPFNCEGFENDCIGP
jgi:hypothetical protein